MDHDETAAEMLARQERNDGLLDARLDHEPVVLRDVLADMLRRRFDDNEATMDRPDVRDYTIKQLTKENRLIAELIKELAS